MVDAAREPQSDGKLTFHCARWPLLNALLKRKGWVEAKEGEVATIAFWDDGHQTKEGCSKHVGRFFRLFSRVYTDLMANKRSLSIAIEGGGVTDVAPQTYRCIADWEKAVAADGKKKSLWFFKAINSSNSKGIHVVDTVQSGRGVLAMAAASATPAAKAQNLSTTFDRSFFDRMLKHVQKPSGNQETAALTAASLQAAFSSALCDDKALIKKKELNYIIQRAVEKPLLIKDGRKFCIRAYVVAFLRPGSRDLECYILDSTIARPNKKPYDAASTDSGAQYDDSVSLYADIQDGSVLPVAKWEKNIFPGIKDIVRRVLRCYHFLPEMRTPKNGNVYKTSPQYKDHFGRVTNKPTRDFPPDHEGRLMARNNALHNLSNELDCYILFFYIRDVQFSCNSIQVAGWDFMVDDNYRVWLLEVNSICNLKHSTSSTLDTKNKTLLAADMYSLFIEPTVKGTTPSAKHLHKLSLA